MKFNWVPVGGGVKTEAEVYRLFSFLFAGSNADDVICEIDGKMNTLPGLNDMNLMRSYFKNAREKFGFEVAAPMEHKKSPVFAHRALVKF